MNIYDEFKQIEEKYRILIQKATSLMKIVPDPKHSLSQRTRKIKCRNAKN